MADQALTFFADMNLGSSILRALQDLGYESPTPIQAATIPVLIANRDVLGQAQTGTGKTAAFALPILARLDVGQRTPQALVLAPTRELAIQVAEAFQSYAAHLSGFHVLPIYGGQGYGPQLSALRRGVHVVVGTPGRVIDHIEKGTLDLSHLKTLVLDEADEMLRMGFIDDVESILQRTPASRQTALFSATMPSAIRRVAQTYLRDPAEVTIAAKTTTAVNIRQRFWPVSGMHKLDALTRILEAETSDGMIIFVRTKLATEELAAKLQARGFAAAAINGDMAQQQRERTIEQLKDGKIDILVATDVAARGLDVERISHVINYDVPYDPESYTHRIGRTGRAGRSGEAILFIAPRERHLLKAIERATRQRISEMELPSIQTVNDARIARFKDQISEALAAGGLEEFQALIEDYERERNVPAIEIAAALAKLTRGDVPLLLEKAGSDARGKRPPKEEPSHGTRKQHVDREPDPGMQTFRIEVGHVHGAKPGNIVGAIANEAQLDGRDIGRIEIYDDYSMIDLPANLPDRLLDHLKTVWVAGRQLKISAEAGAGHGAGEARRKGSRTSERPVPGDLGLPSGEPAKKRRTDRAGAVAMEAYRIEVGHVHGVKPANIVGAIANEAGLESRYIGRIEIFDDHSVIDLPEGMPKEISQLLQTVTVAGQELRIRRASASPVERKPTEKKTPASHTAATTKSEPQRKKGKQA